MAEGVFQHLIRTHTPSLTSCISRLDSCGTGAWHDRDPPDSRTMATLRAHGITTYRHAARRLRDEDFAEFDYILGMDSYNLEEIQKRERRAKREGKPMGGKVMMFGAFGKKEWNLDEGTVWSEEDIVDPYYGADGGFETVYKQCVRFTEGFIGKVLLPGKGADADADAEEK
jgi:low molecular weight phosphotyrosine protein phosphatase